MGKAQVLIAGAVAAVALVLASGSLVIGRLPATPLVTLQPAIGADEHQAMLAALKPPKRDRPVVAIIGINDATETTDYLVPYGILKRADVVDVVSVATQPGPVTLYPALKVEPDATVAEFDERYPEGADYVIVPAMGREDDPAAMAWIRAQQASGATIISVCVGAKVLASAGLLDGRRATTHWYVLKALREQVPSVVYVPDRRFVIDGGVMTTTGITASMPAMLTLIEAIGGHERAAAVALDLGLANWDERHDSGAFKVTRPFATTVLGNILAFWNREQLGIELVHGLDEVSLALVADAWSRTYRSQALSFARSEEAVLTKNGLRIVPDRIAADWPGDQLIAVDRSVTPSKTLDNTLAQIGGRYGSPTSNVVAMQLEYAQPPMRR